MNALTQKQQAKLDRHIAWGNKMKFLRNIHAAIESKAKGAK
tara:strand:- start:62 stop:184 length:123 start_codon:yes stop_codon:yes gene_type:complete